MIFNLKYFELAPTIYYKNQLTFYHNNSPNIVKSVVPVIKNVFIVIFLMKRSPKFLF
jgi:hypothetical protein